MRKDGWTMVSVDIEETHFLMLKSTLLEESIECVEQKKPYDFRGNHSKRFSGRAIYVSNHQIMTALEIIKQFFDDFQIERSKFQIVT
ncbi:hypothetical protein ACFL49_01180 [Candidatus Omnitrophota bacterium]